MPPTGAKPFPPSKKIQALDTEAKGRTRYEDGSLSRPNHGIGTAVTSKRKTPLNLVTDKRTVKQKLSDAQARRN